MKKDELVREEEEIVKKDEIKDVEISTKTVEGDKNAVRIDTTKVKVEVVEKKEEVKEEVAVEAPKPEPEKPLLVAEQMPEFPGGQAEMMKYVQKNVQYPPMARENDIQGTVAVRFVVDKDGSIGDVEVLRGIGGGCDQEAVRVIKSMPPWKAGKQNGQPVKVYFTLPVKFKLE